jgi:hypothetical protein
MLCRPGRGKIRIQCDRTKVTVRDIDYAEEINLTLKANQAASLYPLLIMKMLSEQAGVNVKPER